MCIGKQPVIHLNKYLNLDSAYNTGFTKNNQRTILDSVINYYKDITKYEVGALVQYKITALAPGISHSLLTVDPSNWNIKSIEIFFLDNRNKAKHGDIRNKLLIVYPKFRLYLRWQFANEFNNIAQT